MTRFVPVTVLVMVVAASGAASAQTTGGTGSLPSGATIVFEHRKILDATNTYVEPQASDTALFHYFNLAHCNCAQANVGKSNAVGDFQYFVHETMPSGGTNATASIDFWVGTGCAAGDVNILNMNCMKLNASSLPNVDSASPYGGTVEFNLYEVVNGKLHSMDPCIQDNNVSASIYAFMRANSATATDDYDYSVSQTAGTLSTDTGTASGVDTEPPPLPSGLTAKPGDSAINLSWTAMAANNVDVAYYQALCSNVDGTPARSKDQDARYVTTASLCGAAGDPAIMATPLENGEDAVAAPTGDFGALSDSFICGGTDTGTANSLSIRGLENGTPYQVMLLAVDLHGNYQATYFSSTITPVASTDFWEDLHNDRGSKVQGGLCLLAETYGDDSSITNALRSFRDDTLGGSSAGRWLTGAYYATLARLGADIHGSVALRVAAAVVLAPAVALALLWHWLTLPGVLGLIAAGWWWRRRRTVASRWARRLLHARAVQVAAAIAVIALGAGPANAGGYQPYWEDSSVNGDDNQSMSDEPGRVDWHVGIRLAPYVPDIDKQVGGTSPGPYEQMFGGYHILPMLDVDRILWSGFGQVGVGLSLGYMQKTARTFTMNSTPTDPMRARASDVNSFRLIPSELTAMYRFTWFDDEYGVPVVPYARAGLAYYVWWISLANAGYARVCSDGGMEPTCSQNKALGASLGVTGAIGLSIRAERIDASAATSMRQSGIQHAGVYGELSLAKVDGFGSDTKLSVGDRTWFAGVDFEF